MGSSVARGVNSPLIGREPLFVSVLANQRPSSTRGHRVAVREQLVLSSCATVVVNTEGGQKTFKLYSLLK